MEQKTDMFRLINHNITNLIQNKLNMSHFICCVLGLLLLSPVHAAMICVVALRGEIYTQNSYGQQSTISATTVGDGSSCVYGNHEMTLKFKESPVWLQNAPYAIKTEPVSGLPASTQDEKILSFVFRKKPSFHIKVQDFASGQLVWKAEWDSNLITGHTDNLQSDNIANHTITASFWSEYEGGLSFNNDNQPFDVSGVNNQTIARELGGIRRFASNGSWTERRSRVWITLRAVPSLYIRLPSAINGTCSKLSCMYPANIGVSTDSQNLTGVLSFGNVVGNDIGSLSYRVDDCNGETGGNFLKVQNGEKLFSNGKIRVLPEFTDCKITFKADRIRAGIATWSVPLVIQVP